MTQGAACFYATPYGRLDVWWSECCSVWVDSEVGHFVKEVDWSWYVKSDASRDVRVMVYEKFQHTVDLSGDLAFVFCEHVT